MLYWLNLLKLALNLNRFVESNALISSEPGLNGNVHCSVSYLLITVLFPQAQTELGAKPIQFLIHSGLFCSKTSLNTHIKYNISANIMNSAVLVKISFEWVWMTINF